MVHKIRTFVLKELKKIGKVGRYFLVSFHTPLPWNDSEEPRNTIQLPQIHKTLWECHLSLYSEEKQLLSVEVKEHKRIYIKNNTLQVTLKYVLYIPTFISSYFLWTIYKWFFYFKAGEPSFGLHVPIKMNMHHKT